MVDIVNQLLDFVNYPGPRLNGGTWYALAFALAAGGIAYWALRRLRAL